MLAKRVTCVALAAALVACSDGLPTEPDFTPGEQWTLAGAKSRAGDAHFTGSVDVVWNGGKGSGPTAGADRIARGSITAFPFAGGGKSPGTFTFQVVEADGTVHREIGVELTWAGLEDQSLYPGEIRFVGVVVSDTKACGGSQHGGGDDEGGCGDDEGGCSHDDGGTDEGGCSHDDGGPTRVVAATTMAAPMTKAVAPVVVVRPAVTSRVGEAEECPGRTVESDRW